MSMFRSKAAKIVALYCGLLVSGSAGAVVIDIDNVEFAKLMATGVPLIDIRTSQEWKQTGVVKGSRLLTFFDERGEADPAAWLESARSIVKPTDPVIVICRTGNRTKEMSKFLSDQAGFAKVYNVKNGIADWMRDGRAVTPLSQHMASCRGTNTC